MTQLQRTPPVETVTLPQHLRPLVHPDMEKRWLLLFFPSCPDPSSHCISGDCCCWQHSIRQLHEDLYSWMQHCSLSTCIVEQHLRVYLDLYDLIFRNRKCVYLGITIVIMSSEDNKQQLVLTTQECQVGLFWKSFGTNVNQSIERSTLSFKNEFDSGTPCGKGSSPCCVMLDWVCISKEATGGRWHIEPIHGAPEENMKNFEFVNKLQELRWFRHRSLSFSHFPLIFPPFPFFLSPSSLTDTCSPA